ncbi:HMG-box domain-containing protein [Sporobolomyces koalae]|uniref:HMG-box domain-containing protein n=1 Tax=Sporobolomyces koalae TaxID=500713 RepID=UPI003175781E
MDGSASSQRVEGRSVLRASAEDSNGQTWEWPSEVSPPSTLASSASSAPQPESSRAQIIVTKPNYNNRKTGNPPRPPNAWICYRSARVLELKSAPEYERMPQASISKLIGELWRAESPEVKRQYKMEAAAKKIEHEQKYPDYTFRPVRRNQPKKAAQENPKKRKKASGVPLPLQLAPGSFNQSLPSDAHTPTALSSLPSHYISSSSSSPTEAYPLSPPTTTYENLPPWTVFQPSVADNSLFEAFSHSDPHPHPSEAYVPYPDTDNAIHTYTHRPQALFTLPNPPWHPSMRANYSSGLTLPLPDEEIYATFPTSNPHSV